MSRSPLLTLVVLLAACAGEPPPPPQTSPWQLTRDAVGHYCSMNLVDHAGPKGQILLAPDGEAVWFSSVRDAVAFTRLPEEPRNRLAFYVNDMARGSWESPDPDAWIPAEQAWFVLDSDRQGGMGAPETVPFATRQSAEDFVARHGGRILRLDEIPTRYVLGAVETARAGAIGIVETR